MNGAISRGRKGSIGDGDGLGCLGGAAAGPGSDTSHLAARTLTHNSARSAPITGTPGASHRLALPSDRDPGISPGSRRASPSAAAPAGRALAAATHSAPGRALAPPRTRLLGAFGEAEAAKYLQRAGYRIIERNWVCHDPDLHGELDLITRLRRTLVVFEVKTRSTNRLAHPAEAVTRDKVIRLRRLAARWLTNHRSRPDGQRQIRQVKELRIDVIAIRTRPEPPFAILTLDHLVGVA